MIISLIGMSGSGKTHWAKKLEKKGFIRYSIDDVIESKLEVELNKLGYKGLSGVAKWMGLPYEPQYAKASKTFLELEEQATQKILDLVEKNKNANQNILIDTTGSFIYHKKNILNRLTKLAKIIYLKVTPEAIERQYKLYLRDPKPVIWDDAFKPKKDETDTQALARCYPELLKYRAARYEKLAHLTLDASELRDPSFTTEKFLTKISSI